RRFLYSSQLPTQRDSPAHPARLLDILRSTKVGDLLSRDRAFVSFVPGTPALEILRQVADTSWQEVFPILSPAGKVRAMVTAESLRIVAAERELLQMMVAVDAMQAAVTVGVNDDLRAAVEAMVTHSLREVPVVDATGKILGLLDENDVHRAYLTATTKADE